MDAPLYPPSQAYETPQRVAQQMTSGNASFADFLANPRAKDILLGEVPAVGMMITTPMLKPHLGNMSPRSVMVFGTGSKEAFDRVDALLKAAGIMMGAGQ